MIQKHINLFSFPIKRSRRGVEYFHKVRMLALFLSVISFFALLVVFVIQATFTSNIAQIEKQKSFIESEINKQLEKQISNHLVGMRVQTIEAANQIDVSFASKEASLKRVLADLGLNADITALSIPNKKDFTATLLFPTKKELLKFIQISEEQEFTDKFALVKIGNFFFSEEASPSADLEGRTMNIVGQFL